MDSLKTISLSNGGSLVLSKDHGLVSIAPNDTESFTQCGQYSDEALGETPPDWEQLFNIPVGTTLEYEYHRFNGNSFGVESNAAGIRQISIENVSFTTNVISINYSWLSHIQDPAPPWGDGTEPFVLNSGSAEIEIPLTQFSWHDHYPNEEFRSPFEINGATNQSTPIIQSEPAGLLKLGKFEDHYYWQIGNAEFLDFNEVSPLFSIFSDPYYPGLTNDEPPYSFCYGEYEPIYNGGSFLKGEYYTTFSFAESLGIAEYELHSSYLLNGESETTSEHWVLRGFALNGDTTGMVTSDATLRLNKEDRSTFNVFPNPTSGLFRIVIDKPVQGSCTIIDSKGRTVEHQPLQFESTLQIDLSEKLVAGIYFVVILDEANGIRYKQKLIIQP